MSFETFTLFIDYGFSHTSSCPFLKWEMEVCGMPLRVYWQADTGGKRLFRILFVQKKLGI